MRRASEALAEAKASDSATIRRAGSNGAETMPVEKLAIDLRHALDRDEIELRFQPQVMIATGALMTCLMRGTVGEIARTQDGKTLMRRAMAEAFAVAAAEGHPIPAAVIAKLETRLLDENLDWMASMARDIANRAPRLEADDIVGDLVRRATAFGQDAPIAQAAYCHLQVYEAQQRGK